MSMAVLLAQGNDVKVFDINKDKLESIKNNKSTVSDAELQMFLDQKELGLSVCFDAKSAYKESDYVVIATPTDYNTETNYFDTSSVEEVVKDILNINQKAYIVIKSTIPVGFTKSIRKKFKSENIVFSPEFLREGSDLKDNLFPSRIVMGSSHPKARAFA